MEKKLQCLTQGLALTKKSTHAQDVKMEKRGIVTVEDLEDLKFEGVKECRQVGVPKEDITDTIVNSADYFLRNCSLLFTDRSTYDKAKIKYISDRLKKYAANYKKN